MKPAPFRYAAPTEIRDALAVLSEHATEARLLAGGQSLIPLMNFRKLRPGVVIDLNRIAGLRGIATTPDGLRIGAMTRYADVERDAAIAAGWPILSHAISHIAHQQIRSRGTVGGSLAQNHAGAEMPLVLLALDAVATLRTHRTERRIGVDDLYRQDGSVTIAADEILTEIAVPNLAPVSGWGFREVTRRHGDASVVAAAAVIARTAQGFGRVRVALAGVGRRPVRFERAEELVRAGLTGAELAEALTFAAADFEPPNTPFAPDWYRRDVAAALVARVIADALSGSTEGGHAH